MNDAHRHRKMEPDSYRNNVFSQSVTNTQKDRQTDRDRYKQTVKDRQTDRHKHKAGQTNRQNPIQPPNFIH